jgi:hypothetical protein
MVLPEALREELVDQDVGVIFVDLDLFENDAALALDVRAAKMGLRTRSLRTSRAMGTWSAQRLDVEADGFFAGEGVQVAADGIHLAGDELGGAGAGALEEHVLDEVGNAVGFGGLAAGAGLDPHAHGDGAEVFHALGQDDQTVWQYGAAKIAFRAHRHSSSSIVAVHGE